MATTIDDLPPEVLECIFGYFRLVDRKRGRLVCHRWNYVLSSPRYFKTTKLQFGTYREQRMVDNISWPAGEKRIHCIEVCEWSYEPTAADIGYMVQLFEASRCSLTELSFFCLEQTQTLVSNAIAEMRPVQNFTFITHLRTRLESEPHFNLVRSLAIHVQHLYLGRIRKDLLVRCLNELNFAKLRILELKYLRNDDVLQPEQLGDECRQMLERLHTFRFTGCKFSEKLLEEMLPHFQNLRCLSLVTGTLSNKCIERICSFLAGGLKDMCLDLMDDMDRPRQTVERPALLQLPNLEHLTLTFGANIRLSQQMPRLVSVAIDGQGKRINDMLLDVKKIDGIEGRRLRKLLFSNAYIVKNSINLIGTLSIDVLSFDRCYIAGSLLDVLARPETRRKVRKIVLEDCMLIFEDKSCSVQTVGELRTKCPYLQIAARESISFEEDLISRMNYDSTVRSATY